jgi:hypothetical protein
MMSSIFHVPFEPLDHTFIWSSGSPEISRPWGLNALAFFFVL